MQYLRTLIPLQNKKMLKEQCETGEKIKDNSALSEN